MRGLWLRQNEQLQARIGLSSAASSAEDAHECCRNGIRPVSPCSSASRLGVRVSTGWRMKEGLAPIIRHNRRMPSAASLSALVLISATQR